MEGRKGRRARSNLWLKKPEIGWVSLLLFSIGKDCTAPEPHVHPSQCFTQCFKVLDMPPRNLQTSWAHLSLEVGLHDGDKGKAMPAKLFPDFLCRHSVEITEDREQG